MRSWFSAELRKIPSTIFQRVVYAGVTLLLGYIAFHFRDHLLDAVTIPLWLLILLSITAIITVSVGVILVIRSRQKPKWLHFTSATLDSALWKWKWNGDKIADLAPYCDECGSELEIRDNSSGISYAIPMLATFCPVCNQIKAEYEGVRDLPDQTRKKIIQLRDSKRWLSPQTG